jgi:hypothetical protein
MSKITLLSGPNAASAPSDFPSKAARLIIFDLDNQLGLLRWHTTSATVSAAASTHAFALIHTERRIFYWILLIDPSKSAAVLIISD